ncbi:MAG: hypothetical protein ACK54R_06015, partial [Pirellulaceae bacterium]
MQIDRWRHDIQRAYPAGSRTRYVACATSAKAANASHRDPLGQREEKAPKCVGHAAVLNKDHATMRMRGIEPPRTFV